MKGGVIANKEGSLLWVTISRPERLNALDAAARDQIVESLDFASRSQDIRAIVITGAGNRAFCAGQDLNESAALGHSDGDRWMAGWRRFFEGVSQCTKPMVAAINGTAAGAGLQLALMADIRIAVPSARLLMAEANVGLPAIVGSYLLSIHLGQSRMRELVLTGRIFHAEEAQEWGLIHRLSEPDQLVAEARTVAAEIAEKAPTAMALTHRFLHSLASSGLGDAEAKAAKYQAEAIRTGQPQAAMEQFLRSRSQQTNT
ncbi:enoyl-CoA hydratase/isomerase family protein [Limibacillus sp. MBR-115]|jgi:enoyl-CoA hydratase/carnithine racemase|uniref:enoyl-CoA hydratase/isomerase family protein n=1 Tax=Limibacillus sp. MBR-115 TaxID=3156465 RepID=UPI0033937A93